MTTSNCCCQCPGSCLDCSRKPVAGFCIHPDTLTAIAEAAAAQRVAVHDFLIDAAWQRVQEHRYREAQQNQHYLFNSF